MITGITPITGIDPLRVTANGAILHRFDDESLAAMEVDGLLFLYVRNAQGTYDRARTLDNVYMWSDEHQCWVNKGGKEAVHVRG